MPRLPSNSTPAPKAPGAFLSDGRYSETAEMRHRGHLDGLVRALVARRREGSLTPAQAAQVVEAANATLAFPSYAQWQTCTIWALSLTGSSAEESVKRCGRVSDGHWCGQDWAAGPESSCPEDRHRAAPCPPETKSEQERMFGAFERRSSDLEVSYEDIQREREKSQATLFVDDDIPPPPE